MTQFYRIQNIYFQQNKGLQAFLLSNEVIVFRELIQIQIKSLVAVLSQKDKCDPKLLVFIHKIAKALKDVLKYLDKLTARRYAVIDW